MLRMVSAVGMQMVSQRRSTTFSSVWKTSLWKPLARNSFRICSIEVFKVFRPELYHTSLPSLTIYLHYALRKAPRLAQFCLGIFLKLLIRNWEKINETAQLMDSLIFCIQQYHPGNNPESHKGGSKYMCWHFRFFGADPIARCWSRILSVICTAIFFFLSSEPTDDQIQSYKSPIPNTRIKYTFYVDNSP